MAVIVTERPRSRGAATIAALQPVDVSMRSRGDGCDVVTVRSRVVDLDQVTAMSGLSRGELFDGLQCRLAVIAAGRKPRPHHLPRPVHEEPTDVRWDQPGMVMWLWRMGLHTDGHRGAPVIGYLGLSLLTNLTERQVIGRTGLPPTVLEINMGAVVVALRDRAAAVQWAVWSKLLSPKLDVDRTLREAITRS